MYRRIGYIVNFIREEGIANICESDLKVASGGSCDVFQILRGLAELEETKEASKRFLASIIAE